MAYGDHDSTPVVAQSVTYVLSQEELLRYQVQSVPATVAGIRTAVSVDLVAVVNVPSAIQKSAAITNFSMTSNLVTFTAANTFATGDIVTISGLSVGTYLNGQNLTAIVGSYVNASGQTVVIPAGQFAAGFTHADVGSTSDTGTAKQIKATLFPVAVSFGSQQRGWYPGVTFSGVPPTGSPF